MTTVVGMVCLNAGISFRGVFLPIWLMVKGGTPILLPFSSVDKPPSPLLSERKSAPTLTLFLEWLRGEEGWRKGDVLFLVHKKGRRHRCQLS